ncbi:hypothetical protein U1Q18_010428 [Sarracenia purpurea var. burkii]
MEKTVEFDDNLEILKDLEVVLGPIEGFHFANPLERLGLFIKDAYRGYNNDEDDSILDGDGEDGEIFL